MWLFILLSCEFELLELPACCPADKLNLALFFPAWLWACPHSPYALVNPTGWSRTMFLLLCRGIGALCVSDTKTLSHARGVGSTADALVSCQIDPLPSKTTILLLSLPTVNSPISFFLTFLQSCEFWQMHAVTSPPQWRPGTVPLPPPHLPICPPLPFVASPSAGQQPRQPLAWQFATPLSWCFWLAYLASSVCPRWASACLTALLAAPAFSYFSYQLVDLQPQLWCVRDKLWFFELSKLPLLKNGGVALFSLLYPKQKLDVKDLFKHWNYEISYSSIVTVLTNRLK